MFKDKRIKAIRLYFLLPLFFISFPLSAELTQESEISVLTIEPGEELYSVFGHTAIRIKDAGQNTDLIYNFGTFDFSTECFYMKFIRGDLQYYLSVYPYSDLLYELLFSHRSLYEQTLNLDLPAKIRIRQILDSLVSVNYHYPYKFFGDNCSTRVRDIFELSDIDSIHFNYGQFPENKTYRELIATYLGNKPYIRTGIDILLGPEADKKTRCRNYMFLPDYLMKGLDGATYRENDETKKIAGTPLLIVNAGNNAETRNKTYPIVIWIIVGALFILTIAELILKKYFKWIDRIIFLFSGMLGILLIFMWIWSRHIELQFNINLFWVNPLNLVFIYGQSLVNNSRNRIVFYLLLICILSGLFFFALLSLGLQFVPSSAILMAIIIIIRESRITMRLKNRIFIKK